MKNIKVEKIVEALEETCSDPVGSGGHVVAITATVLKFIFI